MMLLPMDARCSVWCVLLHVAALHLCCRAQTTAAPQTVEPLKYFFGADQTMAHVVDISILSLCVIGAAVALERLLEKLKSKTGTFTTIVLSSVLQETLIVGVMSMLLVGLITVLPFGSLFVLLIKSYAIGLLLMVIAFVSMMLLMTARLVWSRRSWRGFERTRMAASAGGEVTSLEASSAALRQRRQRQKKLKPEDDEDNETAGPRLADAMVASKNRTKGSPHRPLDDDRVLASPTRRSELSSSPQGGSDDDDQGHLVHRPGAQRRRQKSAILMLLEGTDNAPNNASATTYTAADKLKRSMGDFSLHETLFTLNRDLWVETLVQNELNVPPHRRRGADEDVTLANAESEIMFTEYLWKLLPEIMKCFADFTWKAWIVLFFFVLVDGVRAVIVLGSEAVVTDAILVTSFVSYVFVGGVVPIVAFWAIDKRIEAGLKKTAYKPLMRKHDRENQAKMMVPSQVLLFGSLSKSCHVFQIIFLIEEWYAAFFFLIFAAPLSESYGSASFLMCIGAMLPVAFFAYRMPWTLLMMAMLSGTGADLRPDVVLRMRDESKLARGALPASAQAALQEYAHNLPGEWEPDAPATLNSQGGKFGISAVARQREEAANAASSPSATHDSRVVRIKPPHAAFHVLLPHNHVLPHEREYFDQFADSKPNAEMDVDFDDDESEYDHL